MLLFFFSPVGLWLNYSMYVLYNLFVSHLTQWHSVVRLFYRELCCHSVNNSSSVIILLITKAVLSFG